MIMAMMGPMVRAKRRIFNNGGPRKNIIDRETSRNVVRMAPMSQRILYILNFFGHFDKVIDSLV
jgi:hypothetical protein